MKPLLRVLLFVDAALTLLGALVLLVAPLLALAQSVHDALPQPKVYGQLLGLAWLGLAWLRAHAAIDGAMTLPVTRVSGHLNWIGGVIVLVSLLAFNAPALDGAVQIGSLLGAIVAIVLGFAEVRLAFAVQRQSRLAERDAALAGPGVADVPVATEGYAGVPLRDVPPGGGRRPDIPAGE
jgi:hypothetical protein